MNYTKQDILKMLNNLISDMKDECDDLYSCKRLQRQAYNEAIRTVFSYFLSVEREWS